MKLIIKREELLPALQMVNGVVERRQTLPILSNLLISTGPDSMQLTATDMEVELVASIKKSIKGANDVTLPARKLLDICRALPDGSTLNLNVEGDRATVTSGRSRFTLSTLPAREYPLIEMAERIAEFSIEQNGLKALLERTAFAMAQQDVRYYLNGLLLELSKGLLRAVATDGHRLALCEMDVDLNVPQPIQVIVPRKGVLELIRLLKDIDESLRLQLSRNHIRVDLGEMRFTSKLVDGKFPDYEKVIPKEGPSPIIAGREMLRQSLTRASILSNEKYRGVRITLGKNMLKALAHNPDQEEAEEEIEVKYGGEDMEVGFNVSYLLEALSIIRSDNVRITVTDPNASALILPEASSRCKYVVMPMRL
ncbi:MAG: DNA polymerase III subunit beta [Gammaproteobacteria bacterium]|nr:DNA polymerase III subunit beta [Gammaproteobacteria bacterium]